MEEGRVFDQPVEELFYKSDELGDPFLNNSGAQGLGFATADDLQVCWHLSERVNTLLTILFRRAGMQLVDFKLEFGKLPDGHIVLADEFSPDNCRLWDLKTRQHMDKDVFRRNLGDLTVTYEEVLHRLQKALRKEN
jgi:phosphoribosylaminoimidazole-succinocarboxamide synthase